MYSVVCYGVFYFKNGLKIPINKLLTFYILLMHVIEY
jgi:hypothetical protein